MSIKANLASVRARIGQAADRSGRDGSTVKILGVTKFAAPQEMQELVTAGLASFGENRIQQAVERIELFPDVEWHFIGNLQTNKVRFCQQFYLIHSLDRLRLARALNRRAQDWGGKLQKVLVQVNVSGEASKSGLQPERVRSFVQKNTAGVPPPPGNPRFDDHGSLDRGRKDSARIPSNQSIV